MDKITVSRHFQTFLYLIIAVRILSAAMYFCIEKYSLGVYCTGALLFFGYLLFFQLSRSHAAAIIAAIFTENSIYCILTSISFQRALSVCALCFVFILLAYYFQYIIAELHDKTRFTQNLAIEQIVTFLICMLISVTSSTPLYPHPPAFEYTIYWFHMIVALISILLIAYSFSKEIKSVHQVLDVQHETIQMIAHIDPLTGLSNHGATKVYFDETTENSSNDNTLTLILCDITNLKKLNLKYGHDCGDYVLHQTATLLREAPFNEVHLSRWQGEEFLLLFHDDCNNAEIYLNQLINIVKNSKFQYHSTLVPVSISFGVAQYQQGYSIEQLLDFATSDLVQRKPIHCIT